MGHIEIKRVSPETLNRVLGYVSSGLTKAPNTTDHTIYCRTCWRIHLVGICCPILHQLSYPGR